MSLQVERWPEPETPDAKTLRERLQSEGYTVFEWSDAPGTVYGPHSHSEDQSHWIISGELELTVAGERGPQAGGLVGVLERYTLRAGDRDFLPANATHSAFVPGSEPVRYLIGSRSS